MDTINDIKLKKLVYLENIKKSLKRELINIHSYISKIVL